MENASKALIMAGGVLIAIIILSMFVMMYNKVSGIKKTQQEKVQMEQIATFNAEYEAFNKKMMYGADVVTLANKVEEYNKKNTSDQIKITVPEEIINFKTMNKEDQEELLKQRFKCTNMEYGNSGKVSAIKIEKAN